MLAEEGGKQDDGEGSSISIIMACSSSTYFFLLTIIGTAKPVHLLIFCVFSSNFTSGSSIHDSLIRAVSCLLNTLFSLLLNDLLGIVDNAEI